MKIGIVADATCDLPDDFLRRHRINILPVAIRLGEELLTDERDPEQTRRFYAEQLAEKGADAETTPYTAEQIRERFLRRIVLDYDYVFCITVTASRSPIFENATKASFAILNDYKDIRAEHGISGAFALRVVDSRSLFTGSAVLVAEAARMVEAGASANDIRRRIDELRDQLCAYMVPDDLYYIRKRGAAKGEKSVSWLTYAFGSALDIKPVILSYHGETQAVARHRGQERAVEKLFAHAAAQLQQGILTRHLCISYGGPLEQLRELPGYAGLEQVAQAQGVSLLAATMSATAGVNVGARCLSIAYAGELRAFGD
jgi:DegV family protein with EDD domain